MALQLGEAPAKRKKSSIATLDSERVAIDLGIAVTLAVTIELSYYVNIWTSPDGHLRLGSFIGFLVSIVFCGVLVPVVVVLAALFDKAAEWLSDLRRRSAAKAPQWAVPLSVALATVAVWLAGWRAGSQLATAAAAVLPAAIVWLCGIGLVVLARPLDRWDIVVRDIVLVLGVFFGLVAFFQPGIVTADPVALPLFPCALWLCFRLWRLMSTAGSALARAAADVTAAVIAGSVLVVAVVWVATVASLSVPVVAGVREVFTVAASWSSVPWWVWPAVFCALAALGGARLRRPGSGTVRFGAGAGWLARTAQRLTVGLHILLMMGVLVGRSTPATLEQTLAGQLRARYVVAWQRDFDASHEAAAYQRISTAIAAPGPARTAAQAGLLAILAGGPNPVTATSTSATSQELAYATLLGQEEAARLEHGQPSDAETAGEQADEALDQTELNEPIDEPAVLTQSVATLDTEEAAANSASNAAEQDAGNVTSVISGLDPASDDNAADEVMTAYLGSMLDEDPGADVSVSNALSLAAPSDEADEAADPDEATDPDEDEPLDPGANAVSQATSGEQTQISNQQQQQQEDEEEDEESDDDGDD
jgi:hypothetical protein